MKVQKAEISKNEVMLTGVVSTDPRFKYSLGSDVFFLAMLEVERIDKHGVRYIDQIPLIYPVNLPGSEVINLGRALTVEGEIRSHSAEVGNIRKKLEIFVYVRKVHIGRVVSASGDKNSVTLRGLLVGQRNHHVNAIGVSSCGYQLVVSRCTDKSSIIPCISWHDAADTVRDLPEHSIICVDGRVHSRQYIKDGVKHQVYEVSSGRYGVSVINNKNTKGSSDMSGPFIA